MAALVNSWSDYQEGSSNPALTVNGATPGNLLVAVVSVRALGVSGFTANASGWNLREERSTGSGTSFQVYDRIATGTASDNISVTISSALRWVVVAAEYSGLDGTAPYEDSAFNVTQSTTTTISTGSATAVGDAGAAILCFSTSGGASWSPGLSLSTGTVSRAAGDPNTSRPYAAIGFYGYASAGAKSDVWSTTGSGTSVLGDGVGGIALVYKESGGVAPLDADSGSLAVSGKAITTNVGSGTTYTPSFENSWQDSGVGTTTTITTTASAGNTLVGVAVHRNPTTFNAVSGWTLRQQSQGDFTTAVYTKVAAGNDTFTPSWNDSHRYHVVVGEYRDVDTSAPYEASGEDETYISSITTSTDTGTATATSSNGLAVYIQSNRDSLLWASTTVSSGSMDVERTTPTSGNPGAKLASEAYTSSGAKSATFTTTSGGSVSYGAVIVLKASGIAGNTFDAGKGEIALEKKNAVITYGDLEVLFADKAEIALVGKPATFAVYGVLNAEKGEIAIENSPVALGFTLDGDKGAIALEGKDAILGVKKGELAAASGEIAITGKDLTFQLVQPVEEYYGRPLSKETGWDKRYVQNVNFFFEVSDGAVARHQATSFGAEVSLRQAAGTITLWPLAVTGTDQDYAFMGSAQVLAVVSSSTDDDYTGTGARVVRISGLDSNWDQITEDVQLDGTTVVYTTKEFIRVNSVDVVHAGSGAVAAGNISVLSTDETPDFEVGYIATGFSRDSQAVYSIPRNHKLHIVEWTATYDTASNGAAEVRHVYKARDASVIRKSRALYLDQAYRHIIEDYKVTLAYDGPADIYTTASITAATDVLVTSTTKGILVRKFQK